jgi:hypothetical protein
VSEKLRAAAAVLLCLTSGCAGTAGRPAATLAANQGPPPLDVPLFPDRTNQCGPSALAGVLRFWGVGFEPSALKQELYRASLKGSLGVDLMLAAQARGMTAEILDGDFTAVRKELDAGRPVIAFINLGPSFLPTGHFLVVTGYDERRQGLFANTDTRKNAFLPYRTFLKQWERTDRWALSISPPAR